MIRALLRPARLLTNFLLTHRVLPACLLTASLLAAPVFAAPASAAPDYRLPGLFDVTGVAADDMLNLRERPDSSAPIIGRIAPNARNIEVVEEAGGWGRVNVTETSGWVSMRFLRTQGDIWNGVPQTLGCFGTEPFWNVEQSRTGLLFSTPEGQRAFTIDRVLESQNSTLPQRAFQAGDLTLVVTPGQCNDGMSDRAFGLHAMAIFGGDTPRMLTGCCSVQP